MQIQRGPPSPPATSQGRADKIFIPDALLQSETSPGTGFSVPVTWRKGLRVTRGQGLHTQKWGWGAPPPQFSAFLPVEMSGQWPVGHLRWQWQCCLYRQLEVRR